ncbi:MAG: NACHT domain-containing protein [Dehalococcoidia bacterium]|nr:MAG: NACHT domain-containing protein [Dehalococcoidia bacterium]
MRRDSEASEQAQTQEEKVMDPVLGLMGNKVLERVLDEAYDFFKSQAELNIKKIYIKNKIPSLLANFNSIRMVKTLWQIDKPIDVEQFYCPLHFLAEGQTGNEMGKTKPNNSTKRITIDNALEFKTTNNIVIKGIAGQGKTIFLRHLCVKEVERGERIPVFIELRRIQPGETLLLHINHYLEVLNLNIDEKIFKALCDSKKFIFLFDAFDEIPEVEKPRIINEIERLAYTTKNAQIIITTRPDTQIEMSPSFEVIAMDNLRGEEYIGYIDKLADSEYGDLLKKAIKAHDSPIEQLLCTPLLVTMLIFSYRSYPRLPERLSDFYESIFDILLKRHDSSKPGFTRGRRTSLNDHQFRQIFDAFCFITSAKKLRSFKEKDAYIDISQSMKIVDIQDDAENYLKDVKQVTCLLLEEGHEFRFIHNSVQEYYSASFIKDLPESKASEFYKACVDTKHFYAWREQLKHLQSIDRFRYCQYYMLPLCRQWFGKEDHELEQGNSKLEDTQLLNIIKHLGVDFELEGRALTVMAQPLLQIATNITTNNVFDAFFGTNYKEFIPKFSKEHSSSVFGKTYTLDLSAVYLAGLLPKPIINVIQETSNDAYELWKEARSFIIKQDSLNMIELVGK